MTRNIKTLVLGLAFVGGSLMVSLPASAAADVTIGVGGIAFGYSDGYWDRSHNWHAWQNKEEADRYRAENRDHYFDWKHDRDNDKGWRDHDRYWEEHH